MTEAEEQKKLMKWIKTYHPQLWEVTFHVPNERKRSGKQIGNDIAMGLRTGVPDIFIDHPVKPFHGLRIELKRSIGGRLSQAQRKWLERLSERGYKAVCCHGFDEAQKTIEEYIDG